MEIDLKSLSKNKYFLLILIFSISFCVHLIGINKIGRTWDEQFKVDAGYMAWANLASFNISPKSWDFVIEHPMVGKYTYGFFMGPHTIRIDDGFGNLAKISNLDLESIQKGNYINTGLKNGQFLISYDLTTPRLISALFNSLAVTITVFLAFLILGEFWALIAGLLMLVIPRFIFLGQLVTFESLSVFFFILAAILFYKLLQKPKESKWYIFVGIICGLAFWTRYNNYFIFIFLLGWLIIHYLINKDKNVFNVRLLLIPVISFFLGLAIWPLLWNDFPKYLIESFSFHKSRITPSLYFLNRLIVTTPIPIIFGLVIGVIYSIKTRKYWQLFLLWWFFSVLLIHMIIGVTGGGTRYIVIIYPAIGILCAFGYSQILKKKLKYALIPIFIFMIIEMATFFPYYLDYYNNLIGGVKGAVSKNYEFSWWGEGQREIGFYINDNLPMNSTLGMYVIPKYVFPSTRPDIKNIGYLDNETTETEYVAVSRTLSHNLSRDFLNKYQVIYSAKVKGEPLVLLYKRN